MQTVGLLLVAVIAVVAFGVLLSPPDRARDHAALAFADALEVLRNPHSGAALVGAAYAALSRDVEAAAVLLRARKDQESRDLLDRWLVIAAR